MVMILVVIELWLLPAPAHAQNPPSDKINFDKLNPLNLGEKQDILQPSTNTNAQLYDTPGKVISRGLVFAFPIAGAILFIMILWGGFEMLSGATETKSLEAGKQRITAAVIGFILLFMAYWIAQLVQIVFGIQFLG